MKGRHCSGRTAWEEGDISQGHTDEKKQTADLPLLIIYLLLLLFSTTNTTHLRS